MLIDVFSNFKEYKDRIFCNVIALYGSTKEAWPTKNDDFFPYASDEHGYWTGYFTSRPTSKRMIREASSLLSSAKQLVSKVLY